MTQTHIFITLTFIFTVATALPARLDGLTYHRNRPVNFNNQRLIRTADYLPPLEQNIAPQPSIESSQKEDYLPPLESSAGSSKEDYLPPVESSAETSENQYVPPADYSESQEHENLICSIMMVKVNGKTELITNGECPELEDKVEEQMDRGSDIPADIPVDETPTKDENGYYYPKPSRGLTIPLPRTVDQEIPAEDDQSATEAVSAETAGPDSEEGTHEESIAKRSAEDRNRKLTVETKGKGSVLISTSQFDVSVPRSVKTSQ